MSGLTAKCFRTYNASVTLERELAKVQNVEGVEELLLAYNGANRCVLIFCVLLLWVLFVVISNHIARSVLLRSCATISGRCQRRTTNRRQSWAPN